MNAGLREFFTLLKWPPPHSSASNATRGRSRLWLAILSLMWFWPDIAGLFSINVVTFSTNVISKGPLFSLNVVPKPRMLSRKRRETGAIGRSQCCRQRAGRIPVMSGPSSAWPLRAAQLPQYRWKPGLDGTL